MLEIVEPHRLVRPRLRGRSARAWRGAVAYGLVLAGMNCAYYVAIDRTPLGSAKTVEIVGPLASSVLIGHRRRNLVWAATALGGVAVLSGPRIDQEGSLVGIGAALLAAALWAGYVLLTRRIAHDFTGFEGFGLGMCVAAIAVLPWALLVSPAGMGDPDVLGLGAAVAVLSTLVPYGLDVLALRRLAAASYSILVALSPVAATAGGVLLLHQPLSIGAATGSALVVVASVGAVLGDAPRRAVRLVPVRTRRRRAVAREVGRTSRSVQE